MYGSICKNSSIVRQCNGEYTALTCMHTVLMAFLRFTLSVKGFSQYSGVINNDLIAPPHTIVCCEVHNASICFEPSTEQATTLSCNADDSDLPTTYDHKCIPYTRRTNIAS